MGLSKDQLTVARDQFEVATHRTQMLFPCDSLISRSIGEARALDAGFAEGGLAAAAAADADVAVALLSLTAPPVRPVRASAIPALLHAAGFLSRGPRDGVIELGIGFPRRSPVGSAASQRSGSDGRKLRWKP
ncbi:hypothetical protein NL676_025322 [Syzygium grande]|nr:hypothetical protein NL676_025322 [Syzygium grande]